MGPDSYRTEIARCICAAASPEIGLIPAAYRWRAGMAKPADLTQLRTALVLVDDLERGAQHAAVIASPLQPELGLCLQFLARLRTIASMAEMGRGALNSMRGRVGIEADSGVPMPLFSG